MRPSQIAWYATMFIVLAANSGVGASDLRCGQNHYILDLPCGDAAVRTPIGSPGAVATDRFGNVYFSSPNIVFKLNSGGLLTRVAGNGIAGYAGDGGFATEALLSFPSTYPELESDPFDFSELIGALAVDSGGNLYIADAYNNRVRRVDLNGIIATVVGNGSKRGLEVEGAQATDQAIWWPQGVAVDGRVATSTSRAPSLCARFRLTASLQR